MEAWDGRDNPQTKPTGHEVEVTYHGFPVPENIWLQWDGQIGAAWRDGVDLGSGHLMTDKEGN